jgi:hypothetical protein
VVLRDSGVVFWIAHVHAATVARPARRLALGLDPGGPAVCGLIPA